MVDIYWEIQDMKISDYDEAINLWRNAGNIHLSNADSRDNIMAYLNRNPGLSFVARAEEKLVGAILGGHDGRRGLLYHLAIDRKYRKLGIGHALVERCLVALKDRGIHKCHAFILRENDKGYQFWRAIGWKERCDLKMVSMEIP
jgi:N-acetylglutamate synthase